MIFFIVEISIDPTKFDPNKLDDPHTKAIAYILNLQEQSPQLSDVGKLSVKQVRLIAWNEIFREVEDLQAHVLEVAKHDLVCRGMCAQAEHFFGINPLRLDENPYPEGTLINQEEMQKIVSDTFFYWAHPSIGNIGVSPLPRSSNTKEHFFDNWHAADCINLVTARAIWYCKDYLMKPLPVAGRDQVRICYNTTELARAIIGEITCAASKRLEKILALCLCQSKLLHDKQKMLIRSFLQKYGTKLDDLILKGIWDNKTKGIRIIRLEYCSYYFENLITSFHTNEDTEALKYFVECLINSAIDEEPPAAPQTVAIDNQKKITKNIQDIWEKMPPCIRCAILLNDFRKVFMDAELAPSNPLKYSFRIANFYQNLQRRKTGDGFVVSDPFIDPRQYGVTAAAGLEHVPRFKQKGWNLAWSWNRDEYHDTTMTYRHYLCPLWAGASGHTGGTINLYLTILGDSFPPDGAITIACGLFALWRLYYDKRITGVHTLVETFEATCLSEVVGPPGLLSGTDKSSNTPDAYNKVLACALKGTSENLGVDPIYLLSKLRSEWYPRDANKDSVYQELLRQINEVRTALEQIGFHVPQWTYDLKGKIGMDVPSLSQIRSGTQSLSLSFHLLESEKRNNKDSKENE